VVTKEVPVERVVYRCSLPPLPARLGRTANDSAFPLPLAAQHVLRARDLRCGDRELPMEGYVERSKYEALEKEVRRLQQLLEHRDHASGLPFFLSARTRPLELCSSCAY